MTAETGRQLTIRSSIESCKEAAELLDHLKPSAERRQLSMAQALARNERRFNSSLRAQQDFAKREKAMAVTSLVQDTVDYTALHQSHEVVLRVELLAERLAQINPSRDAAVAEIGLGSGDTTKMLVERFRDLVCIDIDPDRIEEVSAFIAPRRASFLCADAAIVEFDRPMDHVFLIGLIEHCADGEAVLINVRKQLAPGGRVHILVNNANSIHRHLGVVTGDIADVRELSPSDVSFGHHRVYTTNSLYAEVSRAGLKVDYTDQHYMKPLPSKMMDDLPIELSRAFVEVGRMCPQISAYTYLEAVGA